MSTVFSPLSDKYKEASYARELAAWEEIYGEPKEESAPAEDAAPAEEQFFWFRWTLILFKYISHAFLLQVFF